MKIKKVVSGLLALSIAVGSMYVVSAKDQYVTRGQVADMLLVAADDYNPNVKKEDIIQGYEDGELHEDWNVTRAEALVMLKRAFGKMPELNEYTKRIAIPKEDFTDISEVGQKPNLRTYLTQVLWQELLREYFHLMKM